jgi:hypothetical protein
VGVCQTVPAVKKQRGEKSRRKETAVANRRAKQRTKQKRQQRPERNSSWKS